MQAALNRAFHFALLCAVALFLSGCPEGLVKPQTTEEKLVYAYKQNTKLRELSVSLKDRGRISAAQVKKVRELNDQVETAIQNARKVLGGATMPQSAEQYTQVALDLLIQIEGVLNE